MLLLLVVVVVLMTSDGSQAYTTCTAVTTDHETTVVCHFEQNIGLSRHNFNVQFFYPNRSADPESILMCNTERSGGLTCRKSDDVNFDEGQMITDHLVFTRPASRDKVGAEYLCQAVPALPGPIQYCILTYMEIPTRASPSLLSRPLFVALLVVSVTTSVIVIIMIVLFVWYKNHERIANWLGGRSRQGNSEDCNKQSPHWRSARRFPKDRPNIVPDHVCGSRPFSEDKGVQLTALTRTPSEVHSRSASTIRSHSPREEIHPLMAPPPTLSQETRQDKSHTAKADKERAKEKKKDAKRIAEEKKKDAKRIAEEKKDAKRIAEEKKKEAEKKAKQEKADAKRKAKEQTEDAEQEAHVETRKAEIHTENSNDFDNEQRESLIPSKAMSISDTN